MLQSLELMPDDDGAARIRQDWQVLRDAGLPSLLDHQGATNAPHVTAVAVPRVDDAARDLAAGLLGELLPLACTLTGLAVLGHKRQVLARLVEVPDDLVAAVLRIKGATSGHPFAGWLPHATLSTRLDRADLAVAMEVLDTSPTPFVLTSVRFWNPETGLAVDLPD